MLNLNKCSKTTLETKPNQTVNFNSSYTQQQQQPFYVPLSVFLFLFLCRGNNPLCTLPTYTSYTPSMPPSNFLSSILCTLSSFPLLLQQPPNSTTMFPYVCKSLLTFHICAVLFPSLSFSTTAHICAYHCVQLSYTTQHRTVLIIFTLILQTIITAWMMSTGGEGDLS